jgi:putative oxidoreductase
MRYWFLFLRVLLGATFLYAGVIKASASSRFFLTLTPFTVIPASWLGTISVVLPLIEVAAGLMMIWPKRWGAALIFLLCTLFSVVIGWALANGIIVSCGCFGNDEAPSAAKMALALARDILLAFAAALVFCEERIRRLFRRL